MSRGLEWGLKGASRWLEGGLQGCLKGFLYDRPRGSLLNYCSKDLHHIVSKLISALVSILVFISILVQWWSSRLLLGLV